MNYFRVFFTLYLTLTGLSPSLSQTLIATMMPPSDIPTDSTTITVTPTQSTTDNPTPTVSVEVPTVISTLSPSPSTSTSTTPSTVPIVTVAPTQPASGLMKLVSTYGSFSPVFSNSVYSYDFAPSSLYQNTNQRFSMMIDDSVSILKVATCYDSSCSAMNNDLYYTICSQDCRSDRYYTYISNVDAKYISILVFPYVERSFPFSTSSLPTEYKINLVSSLSTPTPTATTAPTLDPTAPTLAATIAPTQDSTSSPTPTSTSTVAPTAAIVTPPSLQQINSNFGLLSPSFSSTRYAYTLNLFGNQYLSPTSTPTATASPSPTATSTPTGTATGTPTAFLGPAPQLSGIFSSYGSSWPTFSPYIYNYYFTPQAAFEQIVFRFSSSQNTDALLIGQCLSSALPTTEPTATSSPTGTTTASPQPTVIGTATLLPTVATSDNPTPTVSVEQPTIVPTEAATQAPTSSTTSSPTAPALCDTLTLEYQALCRDSSCMPNMLYDYSFAPSSSIQYLSIQIVSTILGQPPSTYNIWLNQPVNTTTTSSPTSIATVAPTDLPTSTPTPSSSSAVGQWLYLGCFKDFETARIMSQKLNKDAAQDNLLCQQRAQALGFRFAGTQYGSECWASKNFLPGLSSSSCDMACIGNSTQTCGGSYSSQIYQWVEDGATVNPTLYPSLAPTFTPTPTATGTATSSVLPSGTATSASTLAPTATSTSSVLPTSTASVLPTATSSSLPTQLPTSTSSVLPSDGATILPTDLSTLSPTQSTTMPTMIMPTDNPTEVVTLPPFITVSPTSSPTLLPTEISTAPTQEVVEEPTFTLPTAISATEPATDVPTVTSTLIVTPTQSTTDNPTPTISVEVPSIAATPSPTPSTAPTMTVAPSTSAPTGMPQEKFSLKFLPSAATRTMRVSICSDDKCAFNPQFEYEEVCTYCDASSYTYQPRLVQSSTFILVQLFSSYIGNTSPVDYDGVITSYIINIVVQPSYELQQGYWQYKGCYQENNDNNKLFSTLLNTDRLQTNAKCQTNANLYGYKYAATSSNINGGQNCYVGNFFNSQASLSDQCSTQCLGDVITRTTFLPGATLNPSLRPTATSQPTVIGTATLLPTIATSDNPTPTVSVNVPTMTPTGTATVQPTSPSTAPTFSTSQTCGGSGVVSVYEFMPAILPTLSQTAPPPSSSPTISSSQQPTINVQPTVIVQPTIIFPTSSQLPTASPSSLSTSSPTSISTIQPTASNEPTIEPTVSSTLNPSPSSATNTDQPTISSTPSSSSSTDQPTVSSSIEPTNSGTSSPSSSSSSTDQPTASVNDPYAAAVLTLVYTGPSINATQLDDLKNLLAKAGQIDSSRIVLTSSLSPPSSSPAPSSNNKRNILKSLLYARTLADENRYVTVKILPSTVKDVPTVFQAILNMLTSLIDPSSPLRQSSSLFNDLRFVLGSTSDKFDIRYVCAMGQDTNPCQPITNENEAGLLANDNNNLTSSSSSTSTSTTIISLIAIVVLSLLV